MQTIIDYITANLATITTIQQGLFAALAALFQLLGQPKASKLFGTFTTIDLGRVLRYFTLKRDIINGALLVSCVLALAGCGILNPRPSTPCPGLYCLSVDLPGVPGSAKLCYDTDEQRAAAKAQLESQGRKVTVLK